MDEKTKSTISYYNLNANNFYDTTVNVDMQYIQSLFLKYLKAGDNILDLGCGSGRDSKYFIEQGYSVVAVDGSEELCKMASAYLGQTVQCMDFREIDYMELFGGVWACSSLLHLSEDDLLFVFDKVYKSLKPDGYFYISFKYGESSGVRGGRFFLDLTETKLQEILDKQNKFSMIEVYISTDVRPGRENEKWLNAILQKH